MTLKFEAAALSNRGHAFRQNPFDISGDLDVEHESTTDTHEMVVMSFQLLGEFERSSIPIGENLDDHACSFENRQVAVDAALRQIGVESDDVGRRHRVCRLHESIDQSATPR